MSPSFIECSATRRLVRREGPYAAQKVRAGVHENAGDIVCVHGRRRVGAERAAGQGRHVLRDRRDRGHRAASTDPTPLQKTPMAISAISGETLEKRGIDNVTDLLRVDAGPQPCVDQGAGQQRDSSFAACKAPARRRPGSTTTKRRSSRRAEHDQRCRPAHAGAARCSMWSASKCCAVRRARCTARVRWAARCARCSTSRRPISRPHRPRARETTEEGELGYEANAMVNVPLGREQLARAWSAYHRDRGGYIDNVTLGRDDVDHDEISGGRRAAALLADRHGDDRRAPCTSNARMRSSPLGSCRRGRLSNRRADAVAGRRRLRAVQPHARTGISGFATLTGVTSQFNRDLLATIDASRLMAGLSPLLGAPFAPAVLSPAAGHRRSQPRAAAQLQRRRAGSCGPSARSSSSATRSRSRGSSRPIRPPACRCNPAAGAHRAQRSTTRSSSALRSVRSRIDFTDSLALTLGGRYFDYDKSAATETTVGVPADQGQRRAADDVRVRRGRLRGPKVNVAYRCRRARADLRAGERRLPPGRREPGRGSRRRPDALRGGLAVELRSGREDQLVRRPR